MVAKKAAKKAAKKGLKRGRPSKAPEKIEELIDAIERTGSMVAAAKMVGMGRRTIDDWIAADDETAVRILRAREIGHEYRAEQAVMAAKEAEDAGKGRLAFDADRWFLSKIAPRQFGDKLALTGDEGGPIQVQNMTSAELDARLLVLIGKLDER